MGTDDGAPSPEKADHYRDGDVEEIVFAVEEGRVLTIREYPTVEAFRESVADAEYVGEHPGVAELPGIEAFEDEARE
ncbi:hypothetical protein [Natronorarus salvus]|uniref:hypothetical protein n=1 Tax=Natronorarus salvus TaxID=3117733 RepID=UPI002F263EAE